MYLQYTLSLNVCVLDDPKINSLCYAAMLMPYFLMNYKGRVLHITDRMVSYNSLSCLCSWILFFHTSVSQYFITLWSQTSSVSHPPVSPGHSNTTDPLQSVCCPVHVQCPPPPLQLLPGVCKADGPGCNQKT